MAAAGGEPTRDPSCHTHTHTHAHTIIGENVEGKIKKNSFLFCSVRALSPEDLDISKRNTRSPLQELVLSILTRQPAVR
jgi:hypothetical protein